MTRTVVALYDDMQAAQRAVEELVNNGFRRDDISLVVTDREGGYRTASATGVEEAAGGAAAGAGIGGILGGIAGLLVGLGALAIPGVGPIIAAGPLATALAGAGIGAAAGGLLGALVDAGIPEDQAGYYAEGIRRGGILVTARVDDAMHERAREIMDRHSPVNVNDRAAEWRNAGWTGYDPDAGPSDFRSTSGGAETTADYYRERGGISGGGAGATESGSTFGSQGDDPQGTTRRMDSDEHSYTGSYGNRSGLDYTGAAGGTMGDSGAANLPSQRLGHEERSDSITSGTEAGGTWEGCLGTGSGREHMRDTELGHGGEGRSQQPGPTDEQTRLTGSRFGDAGPAGGESSGSERSGSRTEQYGGGGAGETDFGSRGEGAGSLYTNTNANRQTPTFGSGGGGGAGPAGATAYNEQWREHFRRSYGTSGMHYDRYEPAYQFGYRAASESRYTGGSWDTIEPQLRTDWERSHPNDAWDNFKEAVRHAWERVRRGASNLTD